MRLIFSVTPVNTATSAKGKPVATTGDIASNIAGKEQSPSVSTRALLLV